MKGVISMQNLLLMFYVIFCCSVLTLARNTSSSSSGIIRCLPHQNAALLKLKQEFAFRKPNLSYFGYYGPTIDETSYPKMKSWKQREDCCHWDGVTCNMKTGQVVRLDLSNSWLEGHLQSNSSLFGLRQLRQLNLAFNNFTLSQIPSSFGQLSRLTHLNLSHSFFSSYVPSEIAMLRNLISLDLSSALDYHDLSGIRSLLYLGATTLLQNMTSLQELHLDRVNISSSLPQLSLGNLSSLTHLFLRGCSLQGQFPESVFQLPKIEVIDISENSKLNGFLGPFPTGSKLKSLILYETDFSGPLPDSIGNLKSLMFINIRSCKFSGAIPSSFGNLSQLTSLNLMSNNFNGQLPSTMGNLSQLMSGFLSDNNFNTLPDTLGNLIKLTVLDLSFSRFTGELPSSLGNLRQLELLDIGDNRFNGRIPTSLGNLSSLETLSFQNNSFDGNFPSPLTNLTQLQFLDISLNSLTGAIPSSVFQMISLDGLVVEYNQFTGPLTIPNTSASQVRSIYLSGNMLNGQIPRSISSLTNLEVLYLESNNLSGRIELNVFSRMTKLREIFLSNNSISIATGSNSTLPKLSVLGLSSCNIRTQFPDFLRSQDELEWLDLSNNEIKGRIPKWFFKIGVETLSGLDLSHNSISGWEQVPIILPWKYLKSLDLRFNVFRGSLIVPPLSIKFFFVAENKLSGGIHPLFCNLTDLVAFDVSNNHLSGSIPQCFNSFIRSSLEVLNMQGNSLHGKIPEMFLNGSNLKTLDLSHNKLQGKIPRSLINCRALELLNLGHNQINVVFPFWLQNFPELQVLVLRSNKFHGPIWHPQNFFGFMKLRIVDLSFNNFNGTLSSEFFSNWSAINTEILGKSELTYMKDVDGYYQDSVTVMNKGLEMVLVKILTIFTSIDLSYNNFLGEIPSTIGDLKSLIVLNLSSSNFEGHIPSSLGNLTELESLDLSNNSLFGSIPQELASLTFLQYLNLSDNNFTGPIPQSRQFDTFGNSSFNGNSDLCGPPLSKKCQSTEEKRIPDHNPESESESENGFGWKAVVVGYGCGFLVGTIGGYVLFSKKPNLIVRIYGRKM